MNLHPHKRTLSALLTEALTRAQTFHIQVADRLAELEDRQVGLDPDQLAHHHNLEAIAQQIKLTLSHASDHLANELKEADHE